MKLKLILLLFLLPFLMNAQIIKERDVISSGGNFSQSTDLQLDFTIAELAVDLLSGGNITLTQGFNQPSGFFVSIPEPEASGQFVIFPNPFSDKLSINIPPAESTCEIVIYDLHGRTMPGSYYRLNPDQQTQHRINCSHYPPGIYYLRIKHEAKTASYHKVIKTK